MSGKFLTRVFLICMLKNDRSKLNTSFMFCTRLSLQGISLEDYGSAGEGNGDHVDKSES